MLQNKILRKTLSLVLSLALVISTVVAVAGTTYLNTNRDTRQAPDRSELQLDVDSSYQVLKETDSVIYYFRDDRDILAIEDKETGYVWKTGLDVPFNTQIKAAQKAIEKSEEYEDEEEAQAYLKEAAEEEGMTVKELKELAEYPLEDSLNETYTGLANSLITIEVYKGEGTSMTTEYVSSADVDEDEGVSGAIEQVSDSQWLLQCLFNVDDTDLGINVYITLGDDGSITYDIPNDEITGEGTSKLASILITPFLGASGGVQTYYNEDTEDYDDDVKKYLTPGYALVPDGSGALIRFEENKAKYSDYTGDVYGEDAGSDMYYYDSLDNAVPVKDPVMPVFGISQGDGTQSAFVAYADSGAEYMTITATPSSTSKNQVRYTYVYAKFEYNAEYYQVTNQSGDSYRKVQDEMNDFDVSITYQFLFGDGSDGEPKADYTGMAEAYREHLIETGTLTEVTFENEDDIPIRIDFLMCDSKKGIFSTTEVDMTTTDDVRDILNQLIEDGISNINSGLIGWQSKGETLTKPYKSSFSGSLGSKSDFAELMSDFAELGIDISFSREFTTINKTMTGYYGVAAKHLSTQYLTLDQSEILPENAPVTNYGYALPTKSASWLTTLYNSVGDLSSSFTIDGISNVLISSHNSDGSGTTVTEAIELYRETLASIKEDGTTLNLVNPNLYLWEYTDRYLQSDVGTSQYVYETDTVPFLQMVLHGTMEVYAPYSNFSFYSTSDMLKMVDYNISPSFVLTEEPSYLLADTTSSDYYSTEFEQYEELVNEVYETVNEPLSQVINYTWTDRTVLADGVIANEYEKDGDIKTIIINYTDEAVTINNTNVDALSTAVLEGSVD